MRVLPLAMLAILLAGCATPEERPGPDLATQPRGTTPPDAEACDALAAREPSGNAPPLEFFEQEPGEIAARLAHALDDPLVSADAREPTGGFVGHRFPDVTMEWETERGFVALHGEERPWAWRYWGERFWAPLDPAAAEREFFDVLRELGMPVETLGEPEARLMDDHNQRRVDGAASQRHGPDGLLLGGHPYGAPGADFWIVEDRTGLGNRSQFTLRVMHDLTNASVALSPDEIAEAANLAARCHLRGNPLALETFREAPPPRDPPFLEEGSVAYATAVGYQETPEPCHGQRLLRVVVDAVTGAALRVGPPGAGCVT